MRQRVYSDGSIQRWNCDLLDRFLNWVNVELRGNPKAISRIGFGNYPNPLLEYSGYGCFVPANTIHFINEGGHEEHQLLDIGEGFGDHSPIVTSLISGGMNTVVAPNLETFIRLGTTYGFGVGVFGAPSIEQLQIRELKGTNLEFAKRLAKEVLGSYSPIEELEVRTVIRESHTKYQDHMQPALEGDSSNPDRL